MPFYVKNEVTNQIELLTERHDELLGKWIENNWALVEVPANKIGWHNNIDNVNQDCSIMVIYDADIDHAEGSLGPADLWNIPLSIGILLNDNNNETYPPDLFKIVRHCWELIKGNPRTLYPQIHTMKLRNTSWVKGAAEDAENLSGAIISVSCKAWVTFVPE